MKKIDQIVSTLTLEEKELHGELIEECKEREATFEQTGQILKQNVEKLNQISVKILSDLKKFHEVIIDINETCKETSDNMSKDSLAMLPDDDFYHA